MIFTDIRLWPWPIFFGGSGHFQPTILISYSFVGSLYFRETHTMNFPIVFWVCSRCVCSAKVVFKLVNFYQFFLTGISIVKGGSNSSIIKMSFHIFFQHFFVFSLFNLTEVYFDARGEIWIQLKHFDNNKISLHSIHHIPGIFKMFSSYINSILTTTILGEYIIISPMFRSENEGTGKLSNLLKVGRIRIGTQTLWPQRSCS